MAASLLRDLAVVVRTKNSGPFVLTADIMFDQKQAYERVKQSGVLNRAAIAKLYGCSQADILNILHHDSALGIKIVIKRPLAAGSPGDSDVYGCQQHAPLLTVSVP